VVAVAVDKSRHRPAVERIDARADEREAALGQLEHRRGVVEPRREPRLDGVPVRRDHRDQMVGERRADVVVDRFERDLVVDLALKQGERRRAEHDREQRSGKHAGGEPAPAGVLERRCHDHCGRGRRRRVAAGRRVHRGAHARPQRPGRNLARYLGADFYSRE
jgi:hypothetical protein